MKHTQLTLPKICGIENIVVSDISQYIRQFTNPEGTPEGEEVKVKNLTLILTFSSIIS